MAGAEEPDHRRYRTLAASGQGRGPALLRREHFVRTRGGDQFPKTVFVQKHGQNVENEVGGVGGVRPGSQARLDFQCFIG